MSILVTGGAGFIGSNFVHHWMKTSNEPVINLDKLTYAGNLANLSECNDKNRHIFIEGDIGHEKLVADILAKYRPRAIVHFAAESHVDRSIHGPDDFIQTNILGTFCLLKTSLSYWEQSLQSGPFRFIHVSTDEVYGSLNLDDPSFTEENPYLPTSPYSASKASSDHLVMAWYHTYGFPAIITNCSNNYGPYQYPEKLIPLMIHNALAGEPLPIYGDGLNVRDWLYVTDHCRAICRVLQDGKIGETYNIGGNQEAANRDIVNLLCSILDGQSPGDRPYKEQITFVKDRPGHDRRYAINSEKIKKELGWVPEEDLESGLAKTTQWYLNHKKWMEAVMGNSYEQWVQKQYS